MIRMLASISDPEVAQNAVFVWCAGLLQQADPEVAQIQLAQSALDQRRYGLPDIAPLGMLLVCAAMSNSFMSTCPGWSALS